MNLHHHNIKPLKESQKTQRGFNILTDFIYLDVS